MRLPIFYLSELLAGESSIEDEYVAMMSNYGVWVRNPYVCCA
ncbi:MAG: hypothetical protein K0R28_3192 [Paenibacillus sp.]|jgi:hypothetical protein|nr:hypothetical protein [Paenibacillus sp.]